MFSAGDCPDLSGMDGYTRSCLIAAYRHGTFNGMTPGEIYTEWEDGWDPPKFPPCLACKSKTHWCALILWRNPAARHCFPLIILYVLLSC